MASLPAMLARIDAAPPTKVTCAIDILDAWERELGSRPALPPAELASELVLVLPRIARGRGSVEVGVDIAEVALVLRLARDWLQDPSFPSILSAIDAVAQLMRSDASAFGGAP